MNIFTTYTAESTDYKLAASITYSRESDRSSLLKTVDSEYCTSDIITHHLYIFKPLFEGQKCFFKVFNSSS